MEMLQGVWKQHLRPRAVVGYGVKIFLPSLPNYVTRSPGSFSFNDTQNKQFALRLRLHECGFTSIRFQDFETASKSMRFGSVYTEPFSCCLRHAEVITNQRNLGTIKEKEESMILFVSASRNVKYVLIHLD